MRYAMAKVAAKILSGEENNTRKWKCVEELAPNEEGAPKTLRQMEQYMLSFVGCVNISVDTASTPYFSEEQGQGVLKFFTYGDDFGKYLFFLEFPYQLLAYNFISKAYLIQTCYLPRMQKGPFVWSVTQLIRFFQDPKMVELLSGPGSQQTPL